MVGHVMEHVIVLREQAQKQILNYSQLAVEYIYIKVMEK